MAEPYRPGLPEEHERLCWACTVLDYVRREARWGLKDVSVLLQLLGGSSHSGLQDMLPDLRRWYGEPLDIPPDAWQGERHDG